jgi:hypothetical protein
MIRNLWSKRSRLSGCLIEITLIYHINDIMLTRQDKREVVSNLEMIRCICSNEDARISPFSEVPRDAEVRSMLGH